ncbi:MAG: hypothetical protein H7287_10910 [Thermoleophilia bacterium]|nr:hypothetical protein [Thermoleophilia bacterium]
MEPQVRHDEASRAGLRARRDEQRQRTRRRRRNLTLVAVTAAAVVAGAAVFGRGGGDESQAQASRATGGGAATRVAMPAPIADAFRISDDFDHGDAPTRAGWTAVGSGQAKWRVEHRYKAGMLTGPVTGKPGALLIGSPTWTDVAVTATSPGIDSAVVDLVARASADARTAYRLRWREHEHDLRLDRIEDGNVHELARVENVGSEVQANNSVTLHVIGDHLVGSLQGKPLIEADDNRIAKGRIGVMSSGSTAARISSFTADVSVGSFTLAVVPDTQFYVPHRTPESSMFTRQARWLVEHRDDRRIAFVLHEGDIVNNACSAPQWKVASFAMGRLDGKLPYALAPGNNDVLADRGTAGCAGADGYTVPAAGVSLQPFNRASPGPNNFGGRRQRAASPGTWGGAMSRGDASASFHRFEAGGVRFLAITLPWGPTDAQLAWALRVARANSDRVGLVVTHDYLGLQGTLRGSGTDTYELADLPGENDGRGIWSKLVSPAPNIRFVFNGHVTCRVVTDADCARDGAAARRVTKNAAGRPVYQMLANYQSMVDGGEGYLRLLTFTPAKGTVAVETVSVDPTAPKRHEPSNRFTLTGVELGAAS